MFFRGPAVAIFRSSALRASIAMDPAVTGGCAARLGGPAGGGGAAETPVQAVLVIKPSFVVIG